jgi:transcriptional regulator with XRE-family HTH domain
MTVQTSPVTFLHRNRMISGTFGHNVPVESSHPSTQVTPDLRVRAKNIDAELVGARIKLARQRAGLTQGEAAGDFMSTAYISRIEAGQRRASAELLVLLAERLGCDPEELLAPDDDQVARDHVARLTLELDYAEIELRTGEAAKSLGRLEALSRESDVPAELATKARYVRGQALETVGRLTEAIKVFEDLVSSEIDAVLRIRTLVALSHCYREEGDLARACEIGDRAAELVSSSDLHGSAEGVELAVTVAAAHFERGDVNVALRMCARAVDSAERLDTPTVRAAAYWNSSIMHQRQGNIADALPLAQRAVALLEQTYDACAMARLRSQLGTMQLAMDPPELEGAVLNLERARVDMEFNDASMLDKAHNQLARGALPAAHRRCRGGRAPGRGRLRDGPRVEPAARCRGTDADGPDRDRARRRRDGIGTLPACSGRSRRYRRRPSGCPALVRAGRPPARARCRRRGDRGVPASRRFDRADVVRRHRARRVTRLGVVGHLQHQRLAPGLSVSAADASIVVAPPTTAVASRVETRRARNFDMVFS